MPKYRIIASNRFSDEYEVEAKDEEEAAEIVYDEANPNVTHIKNDCVGSEIMECELITDEEEA